ncbi:MAG TPA: hypothetical protein VL051_04240 [Burkholderiaceae bacterium]|nr:hypothetical protein [Burkholderiaceae bacterium]
MESVLSFLGYAGHQYAAFSSPLNVESGNKKTAITGGFFGNSGLAFSRERLPLLHRLWAGVAKVKIELEADERHVFCGLGSKTESIVQQIKAFCKVNVIITCENRQNKYKIRARSMHPGGRADNMSPPGDDLRTAHPIQ